MTTRNHPYKGLWCSLESGEGGGKDTQIALLKKHLFNRGYQITAGREPGGTDLGERIRTILQDPAIPEVNPRTELLLFGAAGVESFEKNIKPALKRGEIYLSNRWRDSTQAYQGNGLGLDQKFIDKLIDFSCNNYYPDITFYIDVNPKIGLMKATGEEFSSGQDKIEARKFEFYKKVREGFLKIAEKNSERIIIIPYIENNPKVMQLKIQKEITNYIDYNNLTNTLTRRNY